MKKTLSFLRDLDQNNNREWFQVNKPRYEEAHKEMIAFAEGLIAEMSKYDVLEPRSAKQSLFRIYRDVRFSKNKAPYKNNWAGYLKRAGAERRGGYYFQIGPNESFVMGGFFGPNAQDLLHLRNQIAQDAEPLRDVLRSKKFIEMFGSLGGNELKSAPRGFAKGHENIDLLRHKQFTIRHNFTNAEVLSTDFASNMAQSFATMLPFFNVMTDYLTTDLNGESII